MQVPIFPPPWQSITVKFLIPLPRPSHNRSHITIILGKDFHSASLPASISIKNWIRYLSNGRYLGSQNAILISVWPSVENCSPRKRMFIKMCRNTIRVSNSRFSKLLNQSLTSVWLNSGNWRKHLGWGFGLKWKKLINTLSMSFSGFQGPYKLMFDISSTHCKLWYQKKRLRLKI